MAASSSGQDLMQSGNATLRRPSVRTPVLLNGLFWLKFGRCGHVHDDQKRQVPGRFRLISVFIAVGMAVVGL